MTTRATIYSQIEHIAAEGHIKKLPPLSDELVLLDSGLDSLAIAMLVARLEQTLGLDPFSAAEEIVFPVTLGDLVRMYEQHA